MGYGRRKRGLTSAPKRRLLSQAFRRAEEKRAREALARETLIENGEGVVKELDGGVLESGAQQAAAILPSDTPQLKDAQPGAGPR